VEQQCFFFASHNTPQKLERSLGKMKSGACLIVNKNYKTALLKKYRRTVADPEILKGELPDLRYCGKYSI
jgi:hypothetical protein